MRSKNDFVNNKSRFSFKKIYDFYLEILKMIEELKEKIEGYEQTQQDESPENVEKYDFNDKINIYKILALLQEKTENGKFYGIKLEPLRRRFLYANPEICDYFSSKKSLEEWNEKLNKIYKKLITFDLFYGESESDICKGQHKLLKDGDHLICACCGATTENYDLTKEEIDFLTKCAQNQEMFLGRASKNDVPMIQVLTDLNEFYKKLDLTRTERAALFNPSEITVMDWDVSTGNGLDRSCDKNPSFLSKEKKKELLESIEKAIKEAEESKSRFSKLFIEQCKTARYEVLILSGENIKCLYDQAEAEDEKIALVKAYYNILNFKFYINSGYCDLEKGYQEALHHYPDFRTADPEINKKILEMKLRR